MSTERVQIVVDVDGAGKATAEVRRLNTEVARTGTAGKKASGGVTAFSKSTDELHGSTKQATPMVGKLSGGIKALGSVAAVTGGVIAAEFIRQGLSLMISEGIEAQKATKQTETVIKTTGGAAKVTAKHVSDLANAISRKAGIDDEAIQSAENLLLSYTNIRNEAGKGNDIFDQSAKAVTDLAAAQAAAAGHGKATAQDLKSATQQIGKALQDPSKGGTALRRAGVDADVIDEAKKLAEAGKKLEAQRLLLRELRKEYGGSAEAQANAFDKLKVNINNIFEAMGLKLLPALSKLAGALNSISTEKLRSALGLSKRDVESFGKALTNVWRGIKAVASVEWPAIKLIVKSALDTMGGIIKVFTGLLTLNFGKAWDGVKQIFKGGIEQTVGLLRAATDPLRAAARAAFNAIKDPVSSAFRSVRATVAGFINDIIDLINKIPGVNIGKINLGSGRGNAGTGEAYHPSSPKTGGGRARGGFVKYARGGLTQIGRPGDRGYDTIPMSIGGQNVMVGSGEVAAVFNRHQQAALNARLSDVGGLPGFFSKVNRPHYAAGGGIFGTGLHWPKVPGGEIAGGVGKWILDQAKKYVKGLFGGGGRSGPAGLGKFDGLPVAKWIVPILAWARANGWGGHITSGYRPPGQVVSNAQGIVAPQGRSNHNLTQYPGGAVDVGDPGARTAGAALAHVLAGYRGSRRLVWGGPVINDWGHFSATGRARGGFIRGKVSVFGPPLEPAGGTAYGRSSADAGIAVNPDGGPSTWNNAHALAWKNKLATVTIGKHRALLRVIDKGPSAAGRKIDVTGAGARKLGISPGSFPTDAIGTASWGNASGGGKKKARKIKTVKLTVQQLRDDRLAGFESQLAAAEMDDDDENPATYADNIKILNARVAYVKKITKKLIAERKKVNARIAQIAKSLKSDKLSKSKRAALTSENTKLVTRRTKLNQDLASYRGLISGDNDSIKSMGAKPETPSSNDSGIGQQIIDLLARTTAIDESHRAIFTQFANNFVGSFDKGGPITRTGMALVHEGEHVVPRGGSLVSNAAPPNIVLNLHSNAPITGSVEVDGRTVQKIDQMQGRNYRRIRVAPGRA